MQRREFITLLGGAAAIWPLAARAQQPAMPVIGFLNNGSSNTSAHLAAAFRQGLSETGYVDGQNVSIEYRWADSKNDNLPGLVDDLVRRHVAIIAVSGGTAGALAAHSATTAIPIVFAIGGDPVKFRLVSSLNRPGGNITGVSFLSNVLLAKQIGILHETIGKETAIGFLINPTNPNAEADTKDAAAASNALGHRLVVVPASTEKEIDTAFANLVQQRVGAVSIFPDTLFNDQRDQLVALATRHRLHAIYNSRQFAAAGGLMSYGTDQNDAYRQVGIYTGRILKGEKPGDLPVMQSTKFEFVINLKTAKALGLTIPSGVLAIADEVIE
jgi:putative tryptophan/tyrosine transport system substrate-binding protein